MFEKTAEFGKAFSNYMRFMITLRMATVDKVWIEKEQFRNATFLVVTMAQGEEGLLLFTQ